MSLRSVPNLKFHIVTAVGRNLHLVLESDFQAERAIYMSCVCTDQVVGEGVELTIEQSNSTGQGCDLGLRRQRPAENERGLPMSGIENRLTALGWMWRKHKIHTGNNMRACKLLQLQVAPQRWHKALVVALNKFASKIVGSLQAGRTVMWAIEGVQIVSGWSRAIYKTIGSYNIAKGWSWTSLGMRLHDCQPARVRVVMMTLSLLSSAAPAKSEHLYSHLEWLVPTLSIGRANSPPV
ncbi:hypothetical protein EDD18DRAFT_1107262 [Armillaria luteobubalina]|uniref:Uncharacterized protein n=1 Tax=Armillaria luteobubalina TaxID=153913 RepID=A0AA39Q151_9AGAR|nr:hypothetical protein EDD18DRAFT_1107262 [Armillaria luteobubalina]